MRPGPPIGVRLQHLVIAAFLAATLVLTGLIAQIQQAPTAAAKTVYPYAKPGKPAVVGKSRDSVALSWKAVPGAPRYRIMYSTSAKFKKPKYFNADTPYREVTKLKSGKTYYFAVRVISKDAKQSLSPYSTKIKVKTHPKKAQYTHLPPADFQVAATASDGGQLSWTLRGKGFRYQVKVSTVASMAKAVSAFTEKAGLEVTGLTAGTAHYATVAVVNAQGGLLSNPTKALEFTTKPHSTGAPTGVKISDIGPTTATARWDANPEADAYRVLVSPTATMQNPFENNSDKPSVKLSGLAAGTKHFLQVIPTDPQGKAVGPASQAVSFTTMARTSATIKVASFNVASVVNDPDNHPWAQRRTVVASQILAQKPDVIGLQEASHGKFGNNDYSQSDDLIGLLDGYAFANPARWNCVNPNSPYNCVPQDRGAAGSTKTAYNTGTTTLLEQGSKKLTSNPDTIERARYVEWAKFQDNRSGTRFFFVNVHIQPGQDNANHKLRITQMNEILAVMKARNPEKLPAYVVGDFNSHKWSEPSNAPYDMMVKAGYVDPLGNTYQSTQTAPGATVEKRIRTEYSSFHNWESQARKKSFINGIHLDYIWASPGIRTLEWENVLHIDAEDNFIGVIPSDHSMIRATTKIP